MSGQNAGDTRLTTAVNEAWVFDGTGTTRRNSVYSIAGPRELVFSFSGVPVPGTIASGPMRFTNRAASDATWNTQSVPLLIGAVSGPPRSETVSFSLDATLDPSADTPAAIGPLHVTAQATMTFVIPTD